MNRYPDPDVGISGGTIRAWNPSNRVETFGEVVHDNAKAITYFKPPYNDTANWASRRDVLLKLNCFSTKSSLRQEDCELSCRVLQAGLKIVYAPEAVVYHRNERNFAGLFREGFQHGMHAIPLLERHQDVLPRLRLPSPASVPLSGSCGIIFGNTLQGFRNGAKPDNADCDLVFNAGKRLGRLMGSSPISDPFIYEPPRKIFFRQPWCGPIRFFPSRNSTGFRTGWPSGSFVRLCRGVSGNSSGVYLRHGMARRRTGVPGLSDVDLTVTISRRT